MLQYTNGFSFALDREKESLIMNCVQRIPKIIDGKMGEETEVENVATLVMDKTTAETLLKALKTLLENEE